MIARAIIAAVTLLGTLVGASLAAAILLLVRHERGLPLGAWPPVGWEIAAALPFEALAALVGLRFGQRLALPRSVRRSAEQAIAAIERMNEILAAADIEDETREKLVAIRGKLQHELHVLRNVDRRLARGLRFKA